MKLLINSSDLEKEFLRLAKQYKKYYWATAWAGISSKVFSDLTSRAGKIEKMIIGIHFYQTHPDFIEKFLETSSVRFIMQPTGTFHPKLYLFYNNSNDWELLIGSANFTNAAFSLNTEATILVSSKSDNSEDVLKSAFKLIEESWDNAKKVSKTELEHYRIAWKNHKPKVDSLSGQYGGAKKVRKPLHQVPMAIMTWKDFIHKVNYEPHHGPESRLAVIAKCKELFESVDHFSQLKGEERKFIAGIPNKMKGAESLDWGLFGSMKGAGVFKNKIIINDINISNALDQIPLQGQITKTHYDNFIKHFTKAFSGVGTASRLLAMKRPDTFICFVSKNKSLLCKDFGIQQANMDYERYWTDVIVSIFDSEWWLHPSPKNNQEEKISEARAAFLDALYYEG
ncbi:MAG: phospholipase D family protein [Sphingobacteriaceae bacterium]|nr:phospholipase D family protein [Sphingobacteriaceae bacterium]